MKHILPFLFIGLLITSCTKEENKSKVFIEYDRAEIVVERADDGRNLNTYSDEDLFNLYLEDLDQKVGSNRATVTDNRAEADIIMRITGFYVQEQMHRDYESGIEFNLSDLAMSCKYTLFHMQEDIPFEYNSYNETGDKVSDGKDHKGHKKDPSVNRTSYSKICDKNVARVKKNVRNAAKI